MDRVKLKIDKALVGVNTRANPIGLPLGYLEDGRNLRYRDGSPSRRPGHCKVGYIPSASADGTVSEGPQALFLDPTSGTEDAYVLIPVNTDVHILPLQFTIDIMIRPASLQDSYVLAFEQNESLDAAQPFWIHLNADGTVMIGYTGEDNQTYTLTSLTAVIAGDDIPLRIYRKNEVMKLVINGVIEAVRNDLTLLPSAVPTTDLLIGAQSPSTDIGESGFEGTVDDFRIWHIAVEGHQHAYSEFPDPRHPGLKAYYRFDSFSENTDIVIDDSPWGNHGSIVGDCTYVEGLVNGLNPVIGIWNFQKLDNSRKVLLAAGQEFYESKVV